MSRAVPAPGVSRPNARPAAGAAAEAAVRTGTIAIIPARGQSEGIPRKNARLLDGVPLIVHVIRAAQHAKAIDDLYVSTDDVEIAELARRNGTKVLPRPAHLAGPRTTLDEVIVSAAEELAESGVHPDYVVTLQPTSPLIRSSTIDRAVAKCRGEMLSTVVTVVNDTHLTWTLDEGGAPVPMYERRVNRQEMKPVFRETGSVVVAAREVLESGSRFGRDVGLVEVSREEAIDIDDNFDWWLADKSLRRRRIVFNVVGNTRLGLGHVYRALTLADRLIDHRLRFLANSDSGLAADLIRRRFYPVDVVAPGEEKAHLLANPPDLLINDVLDTDEEFVTALQGAGTRVINFEDVGPGSVRADRVINAMLSEHPDRRDGHVYHGVEFCCLRDEFYSIEPVRPRAEVKNVLLLFGGTDPNGLTPRCLRWLDTLPEDFTITVIAGIGYDAREELERVVRHARHDVDVVYDTKVVSRYMAQADLAVTSAGRTVFELSALAVPMVVVANHERERSHPFARHNPGTVFLGTAAEIDQERFCGAVGELVRSGLLRTKMSGALRDARARDGVGRVLDVIRGVLAETETEAVK